MPNINADEGLALCEVTIGDDGNAIAKVLRVLEMPGGTSPSMHLGDEMDIEFMFDNTHHKENKFEVAATSDREVADKVFELTQGKYDNLVVEMSEKAGPDGDPQAKAMNASRMAAEYLVDNPNSVFE
jgi:hypothetical protein